MPKKSNLQKRMIYFGPWFQEFQLMQAGSAVPRPVVMLCMIMEGPGEQACHSRQPGSRK
jgi:hypothetical protein